MTEQEKLYEAIRIASNETKLTAEEFYALIDNINKMIYYERINS